MKAGMSQPFFEIDHWQQWTLEFFPWLEKIFRSEVLSGFHEGVEPTWIEWLDNQQAAVESDRVDSVARFRTALTSAYDGIRVFHATRQRSLDDIARRGLRAWSAADLIHQERERFQGRIDPERLEAAIRQCGPEHRANRVYTFSSLGAVLGNQGDDALGRLPNFARHGGEFHHAVSVFLGIADQEEERQASRGYLLACDLPWELLPAPSIDALAADALQSLLTRRFLDPTRYNMLGQFQSVATEHDIPPEAIILAADVEQLMGGDIRAEDIAWMPFPRGT